ncbi:Z1 domain-containing protein [Terrabacter sp. Soil810]|uniref:Z1 domain-containing protein n=1 Tax=Terrabacter sp. Soil810 TaxID=1736418 RepID=UPI00070FB199|nr:Z1 domain-containing protein [Terrabacter sp. Soil810]KRF38935.1 hypothetical protein ASG96_16315 [Terrabacter sp. Soil810]
MAENVAMEQLKLAVSGALSTGLHTEQELRDMVAGLRPVLAPTASDAEIDAMTRELIQRLQIDVDLGTAVTSEDFVSWLPGRRSEIEWSRWKAYKQWLLQNGRPPKVVDKLGHLTDEILDLVGDPKAGGAWGRRGLVIGDVQSGKTGTYLGLFNKAADAGYRLIIVLAGSTESLRQQTQERLDEAFIGRDTRLIAQKGGQSNQQASKKFVGIGLLNETIADAQSMTTVMQDFRKSSLMASSITVSENTPSPYVFVLKKNKSVLNAVQEWLGQQAGTTGRIDLPLLLLDDESDYASVNTGAEESPTAINAAIRGILGKFTRSSYIAFTATPFANIFIDHDHQNDLFPRDYVYSLETPTNYVGASATFGTSDDVFDGGLMDVTDAEAYVPSRHKSGDSVPGLPPSLKLAVRTFLIATAVRDLRGHGGGRSMLVNVSRFKNIQRQVHELVEQYAVELRNAAEFHAAAYADGQPNSHLESLEEAYDQVYSDVEFSWAQVLDALWSSVADIRVTLVNSDRDKALVDQELAWDKPPRMIAVGGDVLSRGLTLDGLSTSYFYRQAGAFDTLMQMARWFGYRDGFQDLTRLWITADVADQFRFVDEAVRELRDDLAEMKAQRLTPADFGLAVKKHPESLLVTARNKMKAATTFKKSVSLGGRRIETVRLIGEDASLAKNESALRTLLTVLGAPSEPANRMNWPGWRGVPKSTIADYLDGLATDQAELIWTGNNLQTFVRNAKSPSMQKWDVVLANGRKTGDPDMRLGLPLYPPERMLTASDGTVLRVSGGSARLAGSSDVASLNFISKEAKEEATAAFWNSKKWPEGKRPKGVPETAFYHCLPRPVLMLYPLRPKWKDNVTPDGLDHVGGHLVVATKIAIPGRHVDVNDTSTDADYIINTVAQQGWLAQLEWGTDAD